MLDLRDQRLRIALAALLALALAGVSVAAFLSGGEEAAPAVSASPEPSPSPSRSGEVTSAPEVLGRAGAKAEFRELHGIAQTLSRHRDIDFLANVFTPDGPMLERARTRIAELLTDQVLDRSEVRLRALEVRRLRLGEVRLLAKTVTFPCFVTDGGRDVTSDQTVIARSILWTMRWHEGRWKLHDAELRDERPTEAAAGECSITDG